METRLEALAKAASVQQIKWRLLGLEKGELATRLRVWCVCASEETRAMTRKANLQSNAMQKLKWILVTLLQGERAMRLGLWRGKKQDAKQNARR